MYLIDLVPFVTGVGEVTRGVKTTVRIVDKATDVVDTAKTIYKTADAASDIRKATGSYEIIYKSGRNYIGKGGFNRAITSATRNTTRYGALEGGILVINIQEVITDGRILANRYILRNGFSFTAITHPANVYDAIVVKYPQDVLCFSPRINGSSHSLKEQIEFINTYRIEKALLIAENIDFITMCPTLKHLRIIPADTCVDEFDYSPLYKMPQIKSLQCSTVYGLKEEFSTCIDCAKINGLENIHVSNSGYKNFNAVKTLKGLGLSHYEKMDISEAFSSPILDTLSIFQSKIVSLEGIQKSQKMQCLYLYYNRFLKDISALEKVKKTLKALRIENCSKINDFTILGELENLELLELSGSNELSSLSFIKKMKKLRTFIFNMNVKDGDLTPCLTLSYVYSEKNRKHYNFKDTELPKTQYVRGNETIEKWRRLE